MLDALDAIPDGKPITPVPVAVIPGILVVGISEPTTIPLTNVKMLPSVAVSRLVASARTVDTTVGVAAGIETEDKISVGMPDPTITRSTTVKMVLSVAVIRLVPDAKSVDDIDDNTPETKVGIVEPMIVPLEIV